MSHDPSRRFVVLLATLTATVLSIGSAAAVERQAPHRSADAAPAQVQVQAIATAKPVAHHHVTPVTRAPAPRRRHLVAAAVRRTNRPAPRPHTTHAVRAAGAVRVHHAVRHRTVRTAPVAGPTGWSALNAAIARIPSYSAGRAMWVISNKYGHWGTADWYHDTLYIAPDVPTNRLYDVAVHEWSHELSVLDYAGDVDAAVKAMNATFGGSGLTGSERAADCMALVQGASWTHYTSCQNTQWRQAARKLVAGQRL